eukprot:TRINITY_DN60935_c0_g1_i2.p1 TRINITY_DN60935_c0_g1~~TRINITY_DN60935_c0_g1_i2.p1  ORF type:complete len:715 (+),score=50.03 TRINITY_DN60935_c0_g1_i2:26-2146(+)
MEETDNQCSTDTTSVRDGNDTQTVPPVPWDIMYLRATSDNAWMPENENDDSSSNSYLNHEAAIGVAFGRFISQFTCNDVLCYKDQLITNCCNQAYQLVVRLPDVAAFNNHLGGLLQATPATVLPLAEAAAVNMAASYGCFDQPLHHWIAAQKFQIILLAEAEGSAVGPVATVEQLNCFVSSEHIGKVQSCVAEVAYVDDVFPALTRASIQCSTCKQSILLDAKEGCHTPLPKNCMHRSNACGPSPYTLSTWNSCFTAHQIIYLKTTTLDDEEGEAGVDPKPDQGESRNTPPLAAVLRGTHTGTVQVGDKVRVFGYVSLTPLLNNQQGVHSRGAFSSVVFNDAFTTHFKVLSITELSLDKQFDLVPLFKEMAALDNIQDLITRSIAPEIFDLDDIKKALACQLFGGLTKPEFRGAIHVLLVGHPGTGKSQMLRAVTKVSAPGLFSNGQSSSGVGLTASAVKTTSGYEVIAGPLVLADGGIVAIDEVDKMELEDISALHEAMEHQTVTIDKASIHKTLTSRTAVLAAANPINGAYKDVPTADQLPFSDSLLSRFDLIFGIPRMRRIKTLVGAITRNHLTTQPHMHGGGGVRTNGWQQGGTGKHSWLETMVRDPQAAAKRMKIIPPQLLKLYISYCKRHSTPELSCEAKGKLGPWLGAMNARIAKELGRSHKVSCSDKLDVDPRKLLGIIRIATAMAKMSLAKEVWQRK